MGSEVVIVAIGDEVLYGMTPNTNAATIAQALAQRGFSPVRHIVVSDQPETIQVVLAQELRAGNDVITTGGLGPTIDDTTRTAVAGLFSQPLVYREEWFRGLVERYGADFPTLPNQSIQPLRAILLNNTVGTAPGLYLEDQEKFPGSRLFVLPGPPQEMRDVFFREVLPRYFEGTPQRDRLFRLVGLMEHQVDPVLRKLKQRYPNLVVGIYPSYALIQVHFAVREGPDVLDAAAEEFLSSFSSSSFLKSGTSLEEAVCIALREQNWKVATAESCTAGGLGARIASISGASDVFVGGVIAYCDSVKKSVLRVPALILDNHGAVSVEVTEAMAQGIRGLLSAEVNCAVSGYFGPTGGTKEAPIGTVCITLLFPDGVFSSRFSFHGSRESICERTIQTILKELYTHLKKA
jgi:nicotinamide-nucleotide amidase